MHEEPALKVGGQTMSATRRNPEGNMESNMDVIVTAAERGTVWQLTDLFGRSMGSITESGANQFTISPEGHALETMAGMPKGPHASLDAVLAEIERRTRGTCRRSSGEEQP